MGSEIGTWNAMALVVCVMVATAVQSAPQKRSVEMEVKLPNGAVPRVTVPDGEGAVIGLPDRTRFGFVPTLHDQADATLVTVTIWDVNNKTPNRLGQVEVEIAGPAVASDTTPSFAIRVPRVITPK